MRYVVNERDADVEIRVSDAAGHTSQLLESMQACQTGSCGCPTDQYDKLAAMDVDAGGDEVTVLLQPLPGEHLDAEQIKACLDHTIAGARASGQRLEVLQPDQPARSSDPTIEPAPSSA